MKMLASAMSALALAMLTLSPAAGSTAAGSTVAAAPRQAASDLAVDLGADTGGFLGGASGSLYGIFGQDVPSDNLIQGMGLQATDTKAQDGQQHPGSDALEIAKPFLASGGRDIYIYMTDVYRNFPYERTSYAQYQGYMRDEVQQALASPYKDHIVLVPYNEPDGNWFAGLQSNSTTLSAFDAEWLQTYQFIKGLWPGARIAGPNFFQYQATALQTFLTFCKANDCLPDVVTWHELNNASTIRPDVAAYRALEAGIGFQRPVSLDEYAARYQLTSPGRMVSYLSAIEDSKVNGDLPYWNINGTLSDSVTQNNIPNGQWWLYNWYSSLSGHTVRVTAPQGNTGNTLQGLATLDPAKKQARVILGGGLPGQADVVVNQVSPAIFGRSVHATIEKDDWSGMTGAAAQPARVFDGDVPVSADGSVSLPVTIPGPGGATGCDATGPRVQGKIGGALGLCGNGEYVSLPSGIADGLGDFTISAWVNPSQDSAWSRLFDFGTGTNDYMFLTMSAGGGPIRFAITNSGGGGEQQINGTGTLPLNTWSLVTVTQSGGTGTLYVNGQPVGTNNNMTLTPADLGATTQNWIGRSQYPADPYLNGAVDDFNIYDHALSAAEVAALASGQPGAGNVADYAFDETGGATATDSSGSGHDATIISVPQVPTSMDAYQIVLSPGGTGSATGADATWQASYGAAQATMTGSGWNINTEGTPNNLGGYATWGDQDVGGLRTGSSTVITFHVNVPTTGDYKLSVFDGSYCQAADVSGPTNIFVRADGGAPRQVLLPCGYQWVIWDHADTSLRLTAGAHDISLSTVGADGAATSGDAIIDKIDLQLEDPAPRSSTVYEAELAAFNGATADYRPQGQSGAGVADIQRAKAVTFWVYAASDGYSDLTFRYHGTGTAAVAVNGLGVGGQLNGAGDGWATRTGRLYLSAGINRVTVTGMGGLVALDKLTVTPGGGTREIGTYPAVDGVMTGTAHADDSYSQAPGGVVTGVGGGQANSLTLTVQAPAAGRYAMTVRYANDEGIIANHYNPDLMTAPADIGVNGAPTFHVNFASTFDWNQFSTLTIPVTLRKGANTIKFIANPQYNWDGTTIGYIYSGSDVGDPLRSDTAPNIAQITMAPFQSRSQ
jgi:hypothetical protein